MPESSAISWWFRKICRNVNKNVDEDKSSIGHSLPLINHIREAKTSVIGL